MTITTRTTKTIGRLAALGIAAGLGVAGIAAAPAAADATHEFSDTLTFSDINPCTGAEHEITVHVDVREHVHQNGNIIAQASRTGTTDDGYVLKHGVDNFVFNGNVARGTINDTWRNADGSAFKAQGHFTAKESGPVVDTFRLRCITP